MIRLASIKAPMRAVAFIACFSLFTACEGPSALDPAGGGTAAEADTALNSTELGARWGWRGVGNQVSFVNVRPHDVTLQVGASAQLTVVARNRLGKRVNNAPVTWASSDSSVAVVTNGQVRGLRAGSAILTASVDGQQDTARAVVTASETRVADVSISPDSLSLVVGQTLDLAARAMAADSSELPDRTVSWSSSNRSIATVNSAGRVSAVARGSATIVATVEGKEARAAVNVAEAPIVAVDSVALSPASVELKVGDKVQLSATLRASSGSALTGRTITWSSSDDQVVTVSSTGEAKALAAGTAAITATSEGKSGTAAVTVTAPKAPSTPTTPTAPTTPSTPTTPTTPSEPTTPAQPVVATLSVSPDSVSLSAGSSSQLTATPKDASGKTVTGQTVSWGSSRTSVATVSQSGKVTAVAIGTATITAKVGSIAGTVKVVVPAPPVVTPPPSTPDPVEPTSPPSSGGSTVERVGYYVAPNGSSGNSGTRNSPWDLASVLRGNKSVGAGDTVWVMGGTYKGAFTSYLAGNASRRVVIRAYPGERATIDGNLVVVGSGYSTFWGLEVMNSAPTGTDVLGINNRAPGTQFVNMVVHDAAMSGFYLGVEGSGATVYGSVVYNNGTNANKDHGIYVNNNSPAALLEDNIIFNNQAYGIHGYTSVSNYINNITVRGNVSFNNGLISDIGGRPDILIGGDVPATGITVQDNYTYRTDDGQTVDLGYSSSNGSLTFTNNYLVGSVSVGRWSSVQQSGNTTVRLSAKPSGTKVVVRPNKFEAGRANIIVYNWSNAGSVSVDLSGVLPAGSHYEIRNAQNFFGSPVASGTYSGGSVSVPLSAITAVRPLGRSSNALSTGSQFGVFVVIPTD
jgi:uncharacterized protein YjdB